MLTTDKYIFFITTLEWLIFRSTTVRGYTILVLCVRSIPKLVIRYKISSNIVYKRMLYIYIMQSFCNDSRVSVVMNVDGQKSVYCILYGVWWKKTLYLIYRRWGRSTTHVTRVKNEFRKKQFDQQIYRFDGLQFAIIIFQKPVWDFPGRQNKIL